MLTATACGGASFSAADAVAGSDAGGSDSTLAGMANHSGAPAMAQGGQASSGGSLADAGETSTSTAGETSIAGAAGAGPDGALDCATLGGTEFSAHCYVDVTTESVPYAAAVASCAKLSRQAGRPGQLLVLDSPEEQTFVLSKLLNAFNDVGDAWLGLACDATQYPEFTSCFCTNCDASQRAEKRAAWVWLDGSDADFGWVGQNPDGEGRCSALAHNPSNNTWGWVDRNCLKTSHELTGYPAHDYRTICELP